MNLFWRRPQSRPVDEIAKRITLDMRWQAHGQKATVWLYSEVDAATLRGVTMVVWPNGTVTLTPLRVQLEALIRNLWSEFRINGRAPWRALVFKDAGEGNTSVSFIYEDMFDTLAGYDRRLQRWVARTAPHPSAATQPVEMTAAL